MDQDCKYGVLGAFGFLGQHITAALAAAGIPCVGGSRRNGVDARHSNSLIEWINDYGITHLINLAAECGGIGRNLDEPADLWTATMRINTAVLEAAKFCAIDKLVMIGTVCSYAHSCPPPFREADLMHHGFPEESNSAYGVAKLAGLFGVRAYRSQYGLDAIYLIPVNMYGPHDNFDDRTSHVIPAMIKRFILARNNNAPAVTCWGTGKATREFLYAGDAAQGIILGSKIYSASKPINLGVGHEISMAELADKIAKLVGYTGRIEWDHTKPDGQPRRCLDTTKAQAALGFYPKTSLDDGLALTIEWYERGR
jgi:GDP-L-fucose synthase